MGRHSHHEHSGAQFEDSHPGCMWGILHILDYHHWHQVRKMLPHRKHRRGRHTRCNGSPTTILYDHDTEASETDDLLVKHRSTETSPTNNRSDKARIKALNQKRLIRGFPARSQLCPTDSVHHKEPSEQQHFCDVSPDWTKPIILLHNSADTSATKSQDSSLPKTPEELVACSRKCDVCGTVNAVDYLGHSHLAGKHELPEKCDEVMETSVDRDVLHHQLKEYADVLEIFKVKKGLFLEILQDADVGIAKHLNGLQTYNANNIFSKSRSFPVADSSRIRNVRPSTLKHKQNEIWSFPKGEKLLAGTKPPKLAATKSPKNYNLQQTTLMTDNSVGSATKQETSFSSLGLAQALNNQGRSQLLINLFKDIKHKIKHALKESKKDSHHSSKDAVLPGVPNESRLSAGAKEASECLNESTTGQDGIDVPRSCLETEVSDYYSSKGRLHNIRKSSSLNESLDKYTQLFECSFGKETKGNRSKSLRLTNEEQVPLCRRAPRSFRKNLSMPDLESFCSLLNEVSSNIVLCSGMAVETFVDHSSSASDNHNDQNSANIHVNTEKIQPPQTLVETELQKNKVERSSDSSASIEYQACLVGRNDEGIAKPHDFSEDTIEVIMMESSPHQEKQIDLMMNSSSEFAQPGPVSVPETCFPESETNPAEFPITEGSELNRRCNHLDEPHCSVNLQNRTSTTNLESVENASKSVGNHFLHFELDEKDDADFNYVKNVLELSGFIENEYLGTWHSLDQPLNPSLFEKLEACFPHELECSEEEVGGNCDHQLLFDLVNETILYMYERSFSYFPKALSFSCCIHPMPIGHHFLQEVWARINRYLSSRPEVEEPFDYAVTRDLAKDDGWMNLQLETECVALELEELIFEELLDEVICS